MLLNNRQQQAQAIARELQKFDGVWVINPMPLNDNNQLRIQILEASCDRNRIFQAVADWGFGTPAFVSMTPRIIGSGMAALIPPNTPHALEVLEDTEVVSCKGVIGGVGHRIART